MTCGQGSHYGSFASSAIKKPKNFLAMGTIYGGYLSE